MRYSFTVLITILMMLGASTVTWSASIGAGDYFIIAKHSYKALTAIEGTNSEILLGQSVRSDEHENAQIWTINPIRGEDERYTIHSRQFGAALSVGGENENGDTSVVLSLSNNAKMSVWQFRKYLNSYGIEAGKSGHGLNVTGNSMADDAFIIVYDASTDDNSQWILYPAEERKTTQKQICHSSEIDNANRIYRLIALPPAAKEADRLRRMKLMDYQPSGIHVRKGEKVSMTVKGLTDSADGLTIMVGPMNSYEGASDISEPQLVMTNEGMNSFIATRNGMIYFHYIDSGFNDEALPPLEVEITRGGTLTPLFIAGKTTQDDWHEMLSNYTASPYIEMMNDHVLVTVTRKIYQSIKQNNPENMLDFLETILSWYDDLSGLDNSSLIHAVSPLRLHYQQDVVSSRDELDGIYMYAADYFVGVPGENMRDLLVQQQLRHAWSIWHETGHKYQQADWTWDDVIETTVNIYSLRAQALLGYPSRLKERDPETGKSPLDLAQRYLTRKKRDFTDSRQMRLHSDDDGEYWVRLVMFDQLRQAYGERFYPALHRRYRENPLTYADARDQGRQIQAFVYTSSLVAGQDLIKFFTDWGVKIEDETKRNIKQLKLPPADQFLSTLGLDN